MVGSKLVIGCAPDSYNSFISGLKNAVISNRVSFMCAYSHLNYELSRYFLKRGFFSEVFLVQYSSFFFLYISLAFYKNQVAFNGIKNLYKPSQYIYLDLKDLFRISFRERRYFVLTTSCGVLSSREALIRGVGGIGLIEYY